MIPRRLLLALAFLSTIIAVALVATGGFVVSVDGVRVSARSPAPASMLAVAAALGWRVAARRQGAWIEDLAATTTWLQSRAHAVVLVVAGLAAAVSVHAGTFSAAGADASGYLSQADMLWGGRLSHLEPLGGLAGWGDGPATLAPLGWRPRGDHGEQVPTYAVGLSLLMALPHGLGGPIAASLVVVASMFVAVWAIGGLAARLGGPLAGVLAAAWLATSPIALLQAIQPMSDVPVTAAWLGCWVLVVGAVATRSVGLEGGTSVAPPPGFRPVILAAGLAAAVAVLIRPNLAPLAAIPAISLLLCQGGLPPFRHSETFWRQLVISCRKRGRPLFLFAAPVAVAGALTAWLQWRWFGSPLRSGYGTAEELYAIGNLGENAAIYTRWLLETHGPWLLAAPLVLLWPGWTSRRPAGRRASASDESGPSRQGIATLAWLLMFAAGVSVAYFLYAVFDDWSYLRFLLPAMAMAIICVSVLVSTTISRLPSAAGAPLLVAVVLAVAASQVATARELGVFRLEARQARALMAGRYLDAALPARAVLVSGEQSGAMRYYTGRSVLRWDLMAPGDLAPAVARLAAAGVEPWIVLDGWEEAGFREKFRDIPEAALDWPPLVDAGPEMPTRAWRLRDRERFLRGERTHTDRVR